jgi:hypothetical protein
MNDILLNRILEKYAFVAFFVALFMLFSPFESAGSNPSMFGKYFMAGISIFMLAPLLIFKHIKPRTPSVLVGLVYFTIIIHTAIVKPTPPQFLLLISANMALAVLIYEASFHVRKQFEAAVCWLLLVNIFAISLQAILFHLVTHSIIDFHKMIFGSESRFAEDYLNIARFTGIQVEPGTYANYIGGLLAILLLSSGFTRRNMWVAIFTLLSIFVTNSGSAMYFAPLLIALLVVVWKDRIRWTQILGLTIGIFLYLHFSGFLEHLMDRFLGHDDGTLSLRVIGFNSYKILSLEDKFIGIGFGADPCMGCHYADLGATFNLFTRGGAIVAIALLILFCRFAMVNSILLTTILFLIPLNEKMGFYEAPLWLFMLFAASGYKNLRAWQAAAAGNTEAREGRAAVLPALVTAPPRPWSSG